MTKEIISWDEYFLNIAQAVSLRSSCLKTAVGAVLVSSSKKIKSTGYNSPPHGVEDSNALGFCNKARLNLKSGEGYEFCRSIHAEQNAIIQAGEILCKDATLYIWGHHFVCSLCKKFIVQSSIQKVILRKDYQSNIIHLNPNDWLEELSRY